MKIESRGQYERPTIERVGSFEEITKGAASGAALDASFPIDTPFEDLTFSD